MNNDNFTEAARAEGFYIYGTSTGSTRGAFTVGAVWAWDHLAAQEPTDAEVLAAAWAICRLQDDGYDPTEDHPCGACTESARVALSAARAARRDEKDAP